MCAKRAELDDTDWKILEILQKEARSTYSDVGEAVGLTRPAARERVLRLEEAGVVTGYSADIETDALGRGLHVMVSFKFNSDRSFPEKPNDVLIPKLRACAEVLRFWEIYGELDFLIECAFRTKDAMHAFLDDLRELGFVRSHLIAAAEKRTVRRDQNPI